MWYVKIAIYGVVAADATTWHPTRNAALAFIIVHARNHNPNHTQFFIGRDGEPGEEVPFS